MIQISSKEHIVLLYDSNLKQGTHCVANSNSSFFQVKETVI